MQNLFIILTVVAVIVLVVTLITAKVEADKAFMDGVKSVQAPPFLLTDYVYRDDHGNEYIVTSADISDNYSLLIEDHGLSIAYIRKHVFLADTRPVN